MTTVLPDTEPAAAAAMRIDEFFARLERVDRPEVWIALRDREELARELAASLAGSGELAGQLFAVKGNIDLDGLETTAACPEYARVPGGDAQAVARLRAAGAVPVGTTNLDQFATGLVGTRSPYGQVRGAHRRDHVSGGSSSGSAVAVALGLVDFALGTDTAGSGRVPAALNGIVGIKPTLGVVSTDGVVPACASYDCVTVFARDVTVASRACGVMAGGPGTRQWPADVPFAAEPGTTVAVPAELTAMAPGWTEAFERACERARQAGVELVEIDLEPFLTAARLLYDGALVAERYAAVGEFLDAHDAEAGAADSGTPASGIDPVVAGIITAARDIPAHRLVADRQRLDELRSRAMAALDAAGAIGMIVPTAPCHPTLDEVAADPVGTNSRMGTYTNFCNLFDLCAVAVPAGRVDEGDAGTAEFGVTVLGRAFDDGLVADIAARIAGQEAGRPWPLDAGARAHDLVVVGAHRRGGPLEHELTSRGAVWDGVVHTAPDYRLFRLGTVPPKPGLEHAPGDPRSGSILGERWLLSPAALGDFLAALPSPMHLGSVRLSDGSEATGFACEHAAVEGAEEITEQGQWFLTPRPLPAEAAPAQ